MTHLSEFLVGDRVRHIGLQQEGTVREANRGVICVEYPGIPMSDGDGNLIGEYDSAWFRTHIGMLINLSSHEHLYVRRARDG